MVEALIAAGADLSIENLENQTAADLAKTERSGGGIDCHFFVILESFLGSDKLGDHLKSLRVSTEKEYIETDHSDNSLMQETAGLT